MPDSFDLQRFLTAQNAGGTYDQAVLELRRGRKRSHWMWFVFPQIAGLGTSPMSRRYAISGVEEATAYLQHHVLGPRLREVSNLVVDASTSDAVTIFGGIDAQKLRSSMTLFRRADPTEPVFAAVLGQFFDGLPDRGTEELLGSV